MKAAFYAASLDDTSALGEAIGRRLAAGDVVALIGDLGAGKTTLTRAIGAGLGVGYPVTSPTFALVQRYPGRVPLTHVDAYRLQSEADVADLALDDYIGAGGVLAVEWADRVLPWLPEDRLTVSLQIPQPPEEPAGELTGRTVTISSSGLRSRAVLSEVLADQALASLARLPSGSLDG